MAQQRKFAGAPGHPKQRHEAPVERLKVEGADQAAPVAIAPRPRGRRAGKRSNPAFRPTTFFVRKETQRRATRLLEDQDIGKDLSDLVEELLAKWILENSQA